MLLTSFSRSCAGCHYQGNPDHHTGRITSMGTAFFQLPYMELDDGSIYWPEEAALGEELTPMMRFLLAGDDSALEALHDLQKSGDWALEYWEQEDATIRLALASAIKRLLHDLSSADEESLRERIARSLGEPPPGRHATELTDQIMSAQFALQTYQRHWLPVLAMDVEGKSLPPQAVPPGEPPADVGTAASGWHIDVGGAAVTYRPVAHSDPLMKSWIEALASHAGRADDEPPEEEELDTRGLLRRALFDDLTNEGFSGTLYSTCLRCHTLDERDGEYAATWSSTADDTGSSGYTKFNHRPHLTIPENGARCEPCHGVAEAEGADAEANDDPPGHPSGMLPHELAQCSGCHAPGKARHDCLTCHVYHMGRS